MLLTYFTDLELQRHEFRALFFAEFNKKEKQLFVVIIETFKGTRTILFAVVYINLEALKGIIFVAILIMYINMVNIAKIKGKINYLLLLLKDLRMSHCTYYFVCSLYYFKNLGNNLYKYLITLLIPDTNIANILRKKCNYCY